METLLVINRIMGRYKSILKKVKLELTLNEVLAIEAIKRNKNTKVDIKEVLLKDKSYISRLINNLFKKGFLEKSGQNYTLSKQGEKAYEKIYEVQDFIKDYYSKNLTSKDIYTVMDHLEKIEEALKKY